MGSRVLTREQAAFLAGFRASGEGWNGEYPHEGIGDEAVWSAISDKYETWVIERIPVQVRQAVEDHYDGTTRGYITAIKEVRQATGWGLAEAKDAVDAERVRRGLSHD